MMLFSPLVIIIIIILPHAFDVSLLFLNVQKQFLFDNSSKLLLKGNLLFNAPDDFYPDLSSTPSCVLALLLNAPFAGDAAR